MLRKEEIKEKKWEVLSKNRAALDIFLPIFCEWKTLSSIIKCYKEARGLKKDPRKAVSTYLNTFKELRYIDIKKKKAKEKVKRKSKYKKIHEYQIKKSHYRLNLNPFYDWLKDSKGRELDEYQKRFLDLFFELPEVRKEVYDKVKNGTNFFKAIEQVIGKYVCGYLAEGHIIVEPFNPKSALGVIYSNEMDKILNEMDKTKSRKITKPLFFELSKIINSYLNKGKGDKEKIISILTQEFENNKYAKIEFKNKIRFLLNILLDISTYFLPYYYSVFKIFSSKREKMAITYLILEKIDKEMLKINRDYIILNVKGKKEILKIRLYSYFKRQLKPKKFKDFIKEDIFPKGYINSPSLYILLELYSVLKTKGYRIDEIGKELKKNINEIEELNKKIDKINRSYSELNRMIKPRSNEEWIEVFKEFKKYLEDKKESEKKTLKNLKEELRREGNKIIFKNPTIKITLKEGIKNTKERYKKIKRMYEKFIKWLPPDIRKEVLK